MVSACAVPVGGVALSPLPRERSRERAARIEEPSRRSADTTLTPVALSGEWGNYSFPVERGFTSLPGERRRPAPEPAGGADLPPTYRVTAPSEPLPAGSPDVRSWRPSGSWR